MLRCCWLLLLGGLLSAGATANATAQALGIALEGLPYPHPVAFLKVALEGEELRLAYMDVPPSAPANGRTVLLLHGRNFPASYWQATIASLAAAGYRVLAPDQLGFGKSSKPVFDYHFDAMAETTAMLLDQLHIDKVAVVGHSMGGMLAVRFSHIYPQRVDQLLLESPIGLEDYRNYVPPVATERLVEREAELSAEGYRHQLMSNYSLDAATVEPFVEIRERLKQSGEFPRWLRSFANSYQMIYREPVVGEIPLLAQDTLFVIGANDTNAPGRAFAAAQLRPLMGHNVELARELAGRMLAARLEVFEGVGHVAHLQAPERFNAVLLAFLGKRR